MARPLLCRRRQQPDTAAAPSPRLPGAPSASPASTPTTTNNPPPSLTPKTLTHRLDLGLSGAAMAFTASQAVNALLLLLYTAWRDARMAAASHAAATWPRPSWAMLQGWWAYLGFALPATVQLCSE